MSWDDMCSWGGKRLGNQIWLKKDIQTNRNRWTKVTKLYTLLIIGLFRNPNLSSPMYHHPLVQNTQPHNQWPPFLGQLECIQIGDGDVVWYSKVGLRCLLSSPRAGLVLTHNTPSLNIDIKKHCSMSIVHKFFLARPPTYLPTYLPL